MRVLVTGATGFIGGHVARRFVAGGAETTALVRPPAGRLSVPGVKVVEADLDDRRALAALAGEPPFDVVCHLAADTRMKAPPEEIEKNVRGTANLLGRLGPGLAGKRFLFASSIAAVDRPRRPRGPLTTTGEPAPRSAYAKTKLRCEELLAEEAAARGFSLTILRLSTIYGPGQTRGGLVTLADAAAKGALAARLPWPGRISFCCVEDVAEAFFRLAVRPSPLSGTFFVAEAEGRTMAEAARILGPLRGGGKGTIRLLSPLMKLARFGIGLPGVWGAAPWSLRAALTDAIWCDGRPLAEALDISFTPLPEGLARTFS